MTAAAPCRRHSTPTLIRVIRDSISAAAAAPCRRHPQRRQIRPSYIACIGPLAAIMHFLPWIPPERPPAAPATSLVDTAAPATPPTDALPPDPALVGRPGHDDGRGVQRRQAEERQGRRHRRPGRLLQHHGLLHVVLAGLVALAGQRPRLGVRCWRGPGWKREPRKRAPTPPPFSLPPRT